MCASDDNPASSSDRAANAHGETKSAGDKAESACGKIENDPLPDPEPSVPSLSEPDPGVFHHEPVTPRPPTPNRNPKS